MRRKKNKYEPEAMQELIKLIKPEIKHKYICPNCGVDYESIQSIESGENKLECIQCGFIESKIASSKEIVLEEIKPIKGNISELVFDEFILPNLKFGLIKSENAVLKLMKDNWFGAAIRKGVSIQGILRISLGNLLKIYEILPRLPERIYLRFEEKIEELDILKYEARSNPKKFIEYAKDCSDYICNMRFKLLIPVDYSMFDYAIKDEFHGKLKALKIIPEIGELIPVKFESELRDLYMQHLNSSVIMDV